MLFSVMCYNYMYCYAHFPGAHMRDKIEKRTGRLKCINS